MDEYKRLSIIITDEIEEKLLELKKQDKFIRCSLSDICRQMILKGVESEHQKVQKRK